MPVSSSTPATPPPLPADSDGGGSGMVILDRWCHIADLPNATTGEGATSTGLRIQATFHAALPPLPSRLCVHCPGLEFCRVTPKVIAADADLVLLAVPVDPDSFVDVLNLDHFVYRPRDNRLDLLPNPHPIFYSLHDTSTALLSRDDGAWYAVAALGLRPPVYAGGELVSWEFDLHLYRSTSDSDGWITKRLSLNEFVRDKVIPLPKSVDRLYHETGKTIAVGGEAGTVAFVDLWRGVFLVDVLDELPVLRDIPLPAPARGNWDNLLYQFDPSYIRDVTVSQNRDSIKYVEMEIFSRTEPMDNSPTPVSVSYVDWVRELNNPRKFKEIDDGWKATTWSMPMPVNCSSSCCCDDWHIDCEIDDKHITLSDPCRSNLSCSDDDRETIETMFRELPIGNPTISIDEDVVYLLSGTSPTKTDKLEVAFAVDVRKGTLRGLAKLDARPKNFAMMATLCTSEICRYLV